MYQFPNKIALSHISADFFHTFKVVTAAHKEKIKIRLKPLPLRPSLTSGLPFTFITKEPEMFLSHGKHLMVTEGFAPIMLCSPGFLRQNFAGILKLPQSQAINTTMPKLGGGEGGGWFLAHHCSLIHLELGKHAWKERANSFG